MVTSLSPPNLVPVTTVADIDLTTVWPSAANGPLSKITFGNFRAALLPGLNLQYLQIANNLSDLANPTLARGFLGLGTAATANIGASGNTVPLLNGNNSWSGIQQYPGQPAFSARLSADLVSVTGDGTAYVVVFNTKIFDQHSDFNTTTGNFVAPVTGLYQLNAYLTLSNILTTHTVGYFGFNAGAAQHVTEFGNPNGIKDNNARLGVAMSALVSLTAGQSANATVLVSGGTKVINLLSNLGSGVANPPCHFSGFLVA